MHSRKNTKPQSHQRKPRSQQQHPPHVPQVPTVEEATATLQHLVIKTDAIKGPAFVLYFYYGCPYCRIFSKNFAELDVEVKQRGKKVKLMAVNTLEFRDAMKNLDIPANGVPHLVYYNKNNKQTVYPGGEREVSMLLSFIMSQGELGNGSNTGRLNASANTLSTMSGIAAGSNLYAHRNLSGGIVVAKPIASDNKLRNVAFGPGLVAPLLQNIENALAKLGLESQTRFKDGASELFSSKCAYVCYVGIGRAEVKDLLYIIIVPNIHIFINNNLLFGVICGNKQSPLAVEIHTDIPNIKEFLKAKRKEYLIPPPTNPIIDKLETMGYTFQNCGHDGQV